MGAARTAEFACKATKIGHTRGREYEYFGNRYSCRASWSKKFKTEGLSNGRFSAWKADGPLQGHARSNRVPSATVALGIW